MGYASMIYNTLISLESEAQLILQSCSLHLTTLEPSLCAWTAERMSVPPQMLDQLGTENTKTPFSVRQQNARANISSDLP